MRLAAPLMETVKAKRSAGRWPRWNWRSLVLAGPPAEGGQWSCHHCVSCESPGKSHTYGSRHSDSDSNSDSD